uniref:Uncharacterized protein n=1 Tax=Hucho hucho TaxID=62062 RepID=A0A4W5KNI7_9TELE
MSLVQLSYLRTQNISLLYSNVCKQSNYKQTLYSLKTWLKLDYYFFGHSSHFEFESGYISTSPSISFLPKHSVQIFGGLVWILVASTHVKPENPQGCLCLCSGVSVFVHDFAIHRLAAFFYLTASVALAKVTIDFKDNTANLKNYQIDIGLT